MRLKVGGCRFESSTWMGSGELKCYSQPLTCLFTLMSCMMPVFTRQVAETRNGGIYTVFNSLAYLCEPFNVALHLLPHVTVNAGHKLGCAQSLISLPVFKKKTTARALAAESLCTCLPFCPVSRLPAIHPKKGSARPVWSPALKYASVEGCSPPCPVWGAQGTTPGSSGTPASTTSTTSKFHTYHTNTTH